MNQEMIESYKKDLASFSVRRWKCNGQAKHPSGNDALRPVDYSQPTK